MGFLVSHVSGNEVVHDFVTLAGADDPAAEDPAALTIAEEAVPMPEGPAPAAGARTSATPLPLPRPTVPRLNLLLPRG